MEKMQYITRRNIRFINEAAGPEATEIKTAVSNMKAVVRKYAKKDRSIMQEMLSSLTDIEKDLKNLAKPAKGKKINETSDAPLYATIFTYDKSEYYSFVVLYYGTDLSKAQEAYDNFINERVEDGVDDEQTYIDLVELKNTQEAWRLCSLFFNNDDAYDITDQIDDVHMLESYIVDTLKCDSGPF